VLTKAEKKLKEVIIKRGQIPIYSIDASYMMSKDIGYIKISRFGSTTYAEFMKAMQQLTSQGLTKLVLDLRGNPGGYLDAAIEICDEFLPAKKMIVYTQGKSRQKKEYKATEKGVFEKQAIVILIDEGSASASEIVAGALQDNDRGTIIGRRSFGKGLVQEQTEFNDGSALRLTIARYYTPTGRCIQKPYKKGESAAYYEDEEERYANGELENADSIHFDEKLKFKTPAGKVVYGGGGIMPDIFVPLDTTGRSKYSNTLFYRGILNDFAIVYADKEDKNLKFNNYLDFYSRFEVSTEVINKLVQYAANKGIKQNTSDLNKSLPQIKGILKALIAKNVFKQDAWYFMRNKTDKACIEAIALLDK
jgi:carboxyl-terminal processing protease